jgi:hypothetical protein
MEPRRYKLVPDDTPEVAPDVGNGPAPPSPVRRRYSLARVAPSSRSALGVDRLERMEEIATLENRNGNEDSADKWGNADPGDRPDPLA